MDPKQIEMALLNKWSREGFLEDIKSDTIRTNTAKVLENQYQYLMKEASTGGTTTPHVADYKNVIIPMVRRIFPHLITNELIAVQPMLSPVGLAYAMRRKYVNPDGSQGAEAGYNTINKDFSGPMLTGTGERLGADTNLYPGATGNYNEMGISIESAEIRAQTRKLKARFSTEVQQDLMAMHNVDVKSELTDLLSYEIAAEIDQEVLARIKQLAKFGGTSRWDYGSVGAADGTADGRWEQEKFRTLYTQCLKASNEIALATRVGAGNFILASTDVCAAFESLPDFKTSPLIGNVSTEKQGASFVGTLGRFKVYRDIFSSENYACVGYKGSGVSDAGMVYSPYVPVMFDESKSQESFNSIMGVMTRYAISDNLLGSENYYRYIDVANLDGGSLVDSVTSGSFPSDTYQTDIAAKVPTTDTFNA